VRGEQLVERSEGAAIEFAGPSIGTSHVAIDHAQQAERFALLLKFLVDAGVVAAEGADSHHDHVDDAGWVQGEFPAAGCRRSGLYSRTAAARIGDLPPYPLLQTSLFQDRDLPGVVDLVLRHALQHETDVVFLAGNTFAQARVRENRYRF
jgi:hypothetical protein